MFSIAETSGVTNLDAMILMVGGHVYNTLNSCMFLIAEPSSVRNVDVMILIVIGHVYDFKLPFFYHDNIVNGRPSLAF
jgi:hypothetical protein